MSKDEYSLDNCQDCALPIKGIGYLCGACLLRHKKHVKSGKLCATCLLVKDLEEKSSANQPNSKGIESETFNQSEPSLRKSINKVSKDYFVQYGTSKFTEYLDKLTALFQAHEEAAVQKAAEWLLEQPSDVGGYTRDSNIRALIPSKWDLSATSITHPQAGEVEDEGKLCI